MAKQLRYPTGVRPLLVAESARRRRAETRVVSVLERAGFDEVILPIIDYAEPYAATGAVESRRTYRFIDRDGDLVAIRSDFTPIVARALAPSLAGSQLPLRVFYRGDVIRYQPSRLGTNREMFQVGAEIIGDRWVQADIEALALVTAILHEFSVKPIIVVTDATIADRIAGSEDAASRVREALAAKRRGAIAELRDELPPTAADLIEKLAEGTATTRDLRDYQPTREVAERLDTVAAACPGCSVHLDDVDRTLGYYTGLRFRAYDSATRATIAQGGRYDTLYGRFGTSAPAVGFTITLDDLD